jgi:autotransporter-associated beta strand protein
MSGVLRRVQTQARRFGLPALVAGMCLGAGAARGQNATWVGGNGGDPMEWVENNNWTPATVPTGTATFTNVANSTAVANDAGVVAIGAVSFTSTALAYTFSIDNPFLVNGTGIANSSTNTQTFNITDGNTLVFQNGSSANTGTGAVIYNNSFFINFNDNSTAGNANATIVNGGIVEFSNNSSAGSANITNNVQTDFFDQATAGNATITNAATGTVTFNGGSTAAMATIANAGALIFNNSSTAGSAHIASSNGATIAFNNSSSAGNATFTSNPATFATYTFNDTSTAANAHFQLVDATLTFNNLSTAANAVLDMTNAMHPAQITFNDTSSAGNSIITNVANVVLGTNVKFLGASTAANATITNNPGAPAGQGGTLFFGSLGGTDTADAGTAHITNNQFGSTSFLAQTSAASAMITNNVGGNTNFQDQSTAANATIINNGGATSFGVPIVGTDTATAGNANITNNSGGSTQFNASTTAGNAIITTNSGGSVNFFDSSTGGAARFIVNAGGRFDLSGLTSGGMTAGSIEGAGSFFLGGKALTVGLNNLSTTVSGVISDGGASGGTGGQLIKVGTGNLTLTNTETYTGATTINAGTLTVDGSIALSSQVNVNSGGTLAGTGTVSTTVVNSGGTLAPGHNNVGTLNVAGNLTFNAGSTFVVDVTPTTASKVNVTGAASLNGTVDAVFGPGSYMATTYAILAATGGRTGTFANLVTVNLPAFLTAGLVYDPNDVMLVTLRSNLTRPGLTANQAAVSTTLDNAFNTGHGTLAGLSTLTPAQVPAALDALSGEGTSGTQEAAIGAGGQFLTAMMEQGAFWRNGGTIDTNGVAYGPMSYAAVKPRASVFKAMPVKAAPVAEEPRYRAWFAGFDGNWTLNGEADPGSASLTHRTGGGAAGLDYRIGPNWLVGAAAGGSVSTFSVPDRATSGTLDGTHIGAYSVARWGSWYTAGALAFNAFDNQISRTIAGVGPTEMATGQFRSDMLGGRLEVGFKQAFNGIAITPFAAAQFAELWQSGYSESSVAIGGTPGVLGLTYAAQTISSLPIFLGAQFDTKVVLGNGMTSSPYARVSWVHELDPTRNITASFITLPATGFTVDGPRAARDAARVDIGSMLAITRNAALFASFDGEFSDRSQMYAGKGGFKLSW